MTSTLFEKISVYLKNYTFYNIIYLSVAQINPVLDRIGPVSSHDRVSNNLICPLRSRLILTKLKNDELNVKFHLILRDLKSIIIIKVQT